MWTKIFAAGLLAVLVAGQTPLCAAETYSGTEPLTMDGDIAAQMVAGIDRFLLDEIDASVAARNDKWRWDFSSPEKHEQAIAENRARLAQLLGVRETREPFDAPSLLATAETSALVAQGDDFDVYAVRWPVLKGINGEGLLLVPTKGKVVADVVAIPDADQTPEQIAGLAAGVPAESQFARRLAESGCRVIIPTLVSREMSKRNGRANLSNREYVYRSSFVQGRHVIGFEIQKILACVDWFAKPSGNDVPIGAIGYGEGGMLALYSAALDPRIDRVCVSGYFAPREAVWQEPIARNVFGRLERYGDAELVSMIWPRKCVIERAAHPAVTLPGEGGAPGQISTPTDEAVSAELARVAKSDHLVVGPTSGDAASRPFGQMLAAFLPKEATLASGDGNVDVLQIIDAAARQTRQMTEMDDYDQGLLAVNEFVRKDFMKGLNTSSVEAYEASAEKYREIFYNDVIGRFDRPLLPFNAQSRKSWDNEKWVGYEVKLDVFPNVFAYGVLLLPKDLKPGEQRPVVVCQHGLEGRPTDCFDSSHKAYNNFASDLCEQGYIVFAPQNPYIGKDDFRTLQRKSNALGKTLFSTIVPQHQQIVNWLKTQPCVDPERIAFYGLSYGGKSAMRIPALVTDYCLSICSGDFNDWVLKTASSRHKFSYVWTGEYEIYEFDLGSTFNYAEMAALICPRPFMVERGHFDGCGEDEFIGWEFGKVIFLYQGKLHLTDRTEIEHFIGGHEIHSQGTFAFLSKHLDSTPKE
ncbi:dienelactone hydrolase family protein [Blastopirellula sp. JC732]|uniref:Dienelactone hydrolase family protein n=1 Tax=Blastopirellula sediminis TaxID=2894196 RepID=A0A9X1MMK0_9BACT|nr:dienelactone hydrolase family protein [Blastopirellula sediminis]MCC9607366.1 dienelactone hydrolase family protein [Blastopirellula sediminis]MCC9629341.1 dienelactone hydrolase family protein [Blastopirellula sediminis]